MFSFLEIASFCKMTVVFTVPPVRDEGPESPSTPIPGIASSLDHSYAGGYEGSLTGVSMCIFNA